MIQKYHWAAIAEQRREARREDIRLGLLATRQIDLEGNEDKPLPASPTAFWCGSIPKIEVMRARVERGEAVFHPSDNTRKVEQRFARW